MPKLILSFNGQWIPEEMHNKIVESQNASASAENPPSIPTLKEINRETIEGKLFMAAVVILTTTSRQDKTPDGVIEECYLLQEKMFTDAT